MKNLATFAAAIILLSLATLHASTDIGVTKIVQTPVNPAPGDLVRIDVYVKNFDSSDAMSNIFGYLKAADNSSATVTPINGQIAKLEPYGVGVLSYNVFLPEEAADSEQSYRFRLEIYQQYSMLEQKDVYIAAVGRQDMALSITGGSYEAGECGKITAVIEPASNVSQAFVTVTATSPFLLNKTETYVGSLEGGKETTVPIDVCIYPDVYSGVYPVLVTVRWDERGVQKNAFSTAGFEVTSRPEIVIASTSTDPEKIDQNYGGEISLVLQNLKPEAGFSVGAELLGEGCVPNSSSTAKYVSTPLYRGIGGKVSFQCKRFESSGSLEIPVKITYKDRFGNEYEEVSATSVLVEPSPKVVVENYSTEMDGTNTLHVNMTLKNEGTRRARSVDVGMDVQWPFSTSQKRDYIDVIEPGQTAQAHFVLNVYSNADQKHYGIDTTTDFKDDDDKSYSEDRTISVMVTPQSFLEYALGWVRANALYAGFAALFVVVIMYFAFFRSNVK